MNEYNIEKEKWQVRHMKGEMMKWYVYKGRKYTVSTVQITPEEHRIMQAYNIKPTEAFRRGIPIVKHEKTGEDLILSERQRVTITKLQELLTHISTESAEKVAKLEKDLLRLKS